MQKLISAAIAAAIAITGVVTVNRPQAQTATTVDYLNVMPLGDSVTRGHGDPAWNGYRYDLQQRLSALGLNPNMVGPYRDGTMGDNNHAGVSGARIDQWAVVAPQLVKDYQPDVVLLMLGTNDIGQRYQLDTAPTRLRDMIYRIRAVKPDVRVFVAAITQFREDTNDPLVDAYNSGVAAMVAALGSAWVHFVPTQGVGEDAARELADHVHPNPCGYVRISWIFYYYMGRSPLNTTGTTWPTGYYPYGTAPGPCAPGVSGASAKWWPQR